VRSVLEPFAEVNAAAVDWSEPALRELFERTHVPDATLSTLESGLGSGVGLHYQGLDEFISYLREWLEPFSEYYAKPLDYIDAGDCVLVPSYQYGIGSSSGARVELELTTLYEVRGGRIAHMHQYDTLEDARAAASERERSD
jgi:hypothetical protein